MIFNITWKYHRKTKWTSPSNFWWKNDIYIYIYIYSLYKHYKSFIEVLFRESFYPVVNGTCSWSSQEIHKRLWLWLNPSLKLGWGNPRNTNLEHAEVQSLLFVTPTSTLMPFTWREFKVSRCGFPLTHAMVRTSTACQGKTCEQGVLIDCAKRDAGAHATDPDDYWLHMYVMLSRATSLRDILLIRAPDATFLLQGPPRELKKRLQMFQARVAKCSKYALSIANQLGFQTFLR